jgi:hypothetical protein
MPVGGGISSRSQLHAQQQQQQPVSWLMGSDNNIKKWISEKIIQFIA